MDTRFLETFIDVVELGSMAAAARKSGLGAAGIAQRLHALERSLGFEVIERHGQTVKPTMEGRAVLEHCKRIVSDVSALSTQALLHEDGGEIMLGAISTALTGALPDLLNSFLGIHPRIRLYTIPGASLTLYDHVVQQQLDAAIIVQPPHDIPKTCGWRVLNREELTLVAPEHWAGIDPFELLRTRPFLRYDRRHWGGKIIDQYLRQHAITPQERLEVDSLEALRAIAAQGGGVALLPSWMSPWPGLPDAVSLRLTPAAPARTIGLLWNRASPRIQLLSRFLKFCTAETYSCATHPNPSGTIS